MSRLDSAIARLQAQRACIGLAARLVDGLAGPVLELGLGNGRTFDHLRELMPERAIFVFDRACNAHPRSTPEPDRLILGEFAVTLPAARMRIGAPAALAHADVGCGDAEANGALAAWLGPVLQRLMRPGGIVLSDQRLPAAGFQPLPLPDDVKPGRYFIYRA